MSSRLNGLFGRPDSRFTETGDLAVWAPAVDVEESDREYLIKTDLPEVNRQDVKVSIEDGVLSVEGERKHEKEEKTTKYHRLERTYGKFVRRLAVPGDVDAQKVAAEFKDGVLSVHLPKSAAAKPRTVDVKVM
jgi:HSP20 family protein